MKSTANFALPYPESSDHTRTWEYWQGLADAVDTLLKTKFVQFGADGSIKVTTGGVTRPLPFAFATGTAVIPNTGSATPSVAFTYPAGRFTVTPFLVCMPYSVATLISIVGQTKDSATVFGYAGGAAVQQTSFVWLAVQEAP